MNIGLYFGTFNPIHHGHLIIASHVLNATTMNQVWFIVSPQNPFKNPASLLNENHRYYMVSEAIKEERLFRASSVEFKLPRPSYTVDTLAYLSEKYPQHQFSIIMGSDSFSNLHKWKNYEVIIKNHPILIYERKGFNVENTIQAKIEILHAPILDISSTYIRELIREKKSIRFLVPDNVKEEIERNQYYSK